MRNGSKSFWKAHTCPPGPELLVKVKRTVPLGNVFPLNHETHERASVTSSGVTSVMILGGLWNDDA